MSSVIISTEDHFEKLFNLDDFRQALLREFYRKTPGRAFVLVKEHITLKESVIDFLKEHGLYEPALYRIKWKLPTVSETEVFIEGEMIFPSLELATLFKLQVM